MPDPVREKLTAIHWERDHEFGNGGLNKSEIKLCRYTATLDSEGVVRFYRAEGCVFLDVPLWVVRVISDQTKRAEAML